MGFSSMYRGDFPIAHHPAIGAPPPWAFARCQIAPGLHRQAFYQAAAPSAALGIQWDFKDDLIIWMKFSRDLIEIKGT